MLKRLCFPFQILLILVILLKFISEFKNPAQSLKAKNIECLKYGINKQERTLNLYYIAVKKKLIDAFKMN